MTEPLPARREALVLSGGGAYGAYAVGAFKALAAGQSPSTRHRPLEADIFSGASAGAFNAAVLVSAPASGSPAAHLENVWRRQVAGQGLGLSNHVLRFRPDVTRFFDLPALLRDPVAPVRDTLADGAYFAKVCVDSGRRFLRATGPLERRAVDSIDLATLFSPQPFQQLVHDAVDFAALRSSPWRLLVAATNWNAGTVQIFANHEQRQPTEPEVRLLSDAIGPLALLASAAIPGVFAPVEIDGVLYADGGVVMNSPLKPAIDIGADVIHLIQMEPDMRRVPLEPGTLDTLYRMLVITNNSHIERDLAICLDTNQRIGRSAKPGHRIIEVHRYRPSEALEGITGLLDFHQSQIENLIELGERDARQHDCEAAGCVVPPS